jgi:hypothetical protein
MSECGSLRPRACRSPSAPLADIRRVRHDRGMEGPLRRLMMLPVPAILVVVTLALFIPAGVYFEWSIREWQIGGSPAALLTERFFWCVWLLRGVGAVVLAVLLLYWRRPGALAVTITASWLAGPPLTFLLKGIMLLAASAGQSSWSGASSIGSRQRRCFRASSPPLCSLRGASEALSRFPKRPLSTQLKPFEGPAEKPQTCRFAELNQSPLSGTQLVSLNV